MLACLAKSVRWNFIFIFMKLTDRQLFYPYGRLNKCNPSISFYKWKSSVREDRANDVKSQNNIVSQQKKVNVLISDYPTIRCSKWSAVMLCQPQYSNNNNSKVKKSSDLNNSHKSPNLKWKKLQAPKCALLATLYNPSMQEHPFALFFFFVHNLTRI